MQKSFLCIGGPVGGQHYELDCDYLYVPVIRDTIPPCTNGEDPYPGICKHATYRKENLYWQGKKWCVLYSQDEGVSLIEYLLDYYEETNQ